MMEVPVVNHPLQPSGSIEIDLYASINLPITLYPGHRTLINTGIGVTIPEGCEGQVRSQSGHGITVLNGSETIDSNYRGEIKLLLHNQSNEKYTVQDGDEIAKLVVVKYETVSLTLDETARGGHGSTDKSIISDKTAKGYGSTDRSISFNGPPKKMTMSAKYCKAYRERKKAGISKPPPKTRGEIQKAYRERQKMKRPPKIQRAHNDQKRETKPSLKEKQRESATENSLRCHFGTFKDVPMNRSTVIITDVTEE